MTALLLASPPLHPLVVHGAVVLTPIFAMAVIAFVVRPSWRWFLRWPTVVTGVLAAGFVQVSRMAGDVLAHTMSDNRAAIGAHEQMADLLTMCLYPCVVLFLVAAWTLPGATGLASGRLGREERWRPWGRLAGGASVLLAAACLVTVVLAGHSGAVAVWR